MRGLEITELEEVITALEGDELLVIVTDPDGVPINKKILIGGAYLTSIFPIPGQIMFTVPGTLAVGEDQAPWFICGVPTGLTLISTAVAVKTASSGTIRVDIHHSGNCGRDWASIYSTRPSISSGERCAESGRLSTTYIQQGSILRLDIDQVGASVAGADLTVSLRVEQSVGVTTSTSTTTLTSSSTSTTTGTVTSTSTTTGTTTTTLSWQSPVAIFSKCGEHPGGLADYFIDGNVYSYWLHWVNEDHEIIVDLGETKYVEKIRLWVYGTFEQSQWEFCQVYISDTVGVWGPPVDPWCVFKGGEFEPEWVEQTLVIPKAGRYLMLYMIDTEDIDNWVMGAEFQVYAS